MFYLVAHNPLVVLYMLQAITYSAAATLSRRGYRKAVTVCYLASAVFRGILGACLFLHLG
jgi:hypothetical protein